MGESMMRVESNNRWRNIDIKLLGNSMQAGKLQVHAADRQHAGLKEVHVAIFVSRYLATHSPTTQVIIAC